MNMRLLALGLLLAIPSSFGFAQQSGGGPSRTVVLTALSAPAGDSVAATLASTINSGLGVLLRLSGGVHIARADFLSPEYDFSKSLMYYNIVGAQAGIFGRVAPVKSGGYKIEVDIWTEESGKRKPRLYSQTISNILSIFGVTDELSVRVASRAVGKKLELGNLQVKITGNLPHFSVYADGQLLGRDKRSFRVLTGKREIVIAKPGLVGDETIKAFHVDISASKPTVVALDMSKTGSTSALASSSKPHSPGPPAKKATVGRLIVQITPGAQTPDSINLLIKGKSQTVRLSNSNPGAPFVAVLKPGRYELAASLNDDPTPTVSHVTVELGKQIRVGEAVGFSPAYHRKQLIRNRTYATVRLQGVQRARSKKALGGLITGLIGLAGGGTATVGYLLASSALATYQAATNPVDASNSRLSVSTDRWITYGGAAAGALFLGIAAVDFLSMPSTASFTSKVNDLDKQIRALGESGNQPIETTAKVLSVTPLASSVGSSGPIIQTVAGNGNNGLLGTTSTTGTVLYNPYDVAVDAQGNLYIAELSDNVIGKVDVKTGAVTIVAGNQASGFSGDGGPAVKARLAQPESVAVDRAGNIYIADSGNERVRRVDAKTGRITTIAGRGRGGFSGDGGPAVRALLSSPSSVAVDREGNVYIADQGNHRIRRVDMKTGIITTVAGGGARGHLGDGGPATAAYLDGPSGVAVDAAGNIYIADHYGQRVRKVDRSGTITTIAGTGFPGFSGDLSDARDASLNYPTDVAVDARGDVYISDTNNSRIRVINTSGIISTVAGLGAAGFSGDGTIATSAELDQPMGIAVDSNGDLYIADSSNNRIREVVALQ